MFSTQDYKCWENDRNIYINIYLSQAIRDNFYYYCLVDLYWIYLFLVNGLIFDQNTGQFSKRIIMHGK